MGQPEVTRARLSTKLTALSWRATRFNASGSCSCQPPTPTCWMRSGEGGGGRRTAAATAWLTSTAPLSSAAPGLVNWPGGAAGGAAAAALASPAAGWRGVVVVLLMCCTCSSSSSSVSARCGAGGMELRVCNERCMGNARRRRSVAGGRQARALCQPCHAPLKPCPLATSLPHPTARPL